MVFATTSPDLEVHNGSEQPDFRDNNRSERVREQVKQAVRSKQISAVQVNGQAKGSVLTY